jgi:hypothetical protein
MRGRRVWGLTVLAAVNIVLLAALVVGLELVFGSWLQPYVPPRSAIVGRTNTYSQNLYSPPSVVTYARDTYGLRSVRGPLENVKFVSVGGSTTDQRFITEGATWHDVASALTGFQIANAGIDGMTSAGHVMAVQQWLHKIPKLRAFYYLHFSVSRPPRTDILSRAPTFTNDFNGTLRQAPTGLRSISLHRGS